MTGMGSPQGVPGGGGAGPAPSVVGMTACSSCLGNRAAESGRSPGPAPGGGAAAAEPDGLLGFAPSLAHPATSGGLGAGLGALELSQREGEAFHPGTSTTVFAKGPVGCWTDGRGCRAAVVVHVGIRAGGRKVGGERVLGVRRGHYEFLQAKRCVRFLRSHV